MALETVLLPSLLIEPPLNHFCDKNTERHKNVSTNIVVIYFPLNSSHSFVTTVYSVVSSACCIQQLTNESSFIPSP